MRTLFATPTLAELAATLGVHAKWRCRAIGSPLTHADHAGAAAADRSDARRTSTGSSHACRAGSPTSRTSTRCRRCRRASCSTTCWRAGRSLSADRPAGLRRSRDRLDRYLAARAAGGRSPRHPAHGVRWEGCRRAGAGGLAPGAGCRAPRSSSIRQDGPVAEQLARRFDPRRHRIDLTQAPLLRFVSRRIPATGAGCCCSCSTT